MKHLFILLLLYNFELFSQQNTILSFQNKVVSIDIFTHKDSLEIQIENDCVDEVNFYFPKYILSSDLYINKEIEEFYIGNDFEKWIEIDNAELLNSDSSLHRLDCEKNKVVMRFKIYNSKALNFDFNYQYKDFCCDDFRENELIFYIPFNNTGQ